MPAAQVIPTGGLFRREAIDHYVKGYVGESRVLRLSRSTERWFYVVFLALCAFGLISYAYFMQLMRGS
jgi:hypothetical protein